MLFGDLETGVSEGLSDDAVGIVDNLIEILRFTARLYCENRAHGSETLNPDFRLGMWEDIRDLTDPLPEQLHCQIMVGRVVELG